MINKRKFNIEKIKKNINEWVLDESQKKTFFHRSTEKIKSFLNNEYDNAGLLSGNLNRLSTWYFNIGVDSVLNGKDSGHDDILLSCIYNYWHIRITYNFNLKINKKTTLDLNDIALSLSKLLALGLFNFSDGIAKVLTDGIASDLLLGLSTKSIASYIMQLYCKWKKFPLPNQMNDFLKPNQVHQQMIENLESEDIEIIKENIENACNFHVSRSKYDTNKEYYEFSVDRYMIYPVEILSFLKIREQLKLSNPTLSHVLMDSPLGRLHSFDEIPNAPFIEEILQKPIIKDLLYE